MRRSTFEKHILGRGNEGKLTCDTKVGLNPKQLKHTAFKILRDILAWDLLVQKWGNPEAG